jgi:hypothetical protein
MSPRGFPFLRDPGGIPQQAGRLGSVREATLFSDIGWCDG